MEANKNLYQALCNAQTEIRSAEFDGNNPYYKSNYSTLSAVMKVCRTPLSKNGLSIMQILDTIDGKTYLKTRLAHISGEFIESNIILDPGTIQGDKRWHAIGAAITYARRYSLSALLGIISGSDEDDDGNKANEASIEVVDKEQREELKEMIKVLTVEKYWLFLKLNELDSLNNLPKDKYKNTVSFLTKFIKAHGKGEEPK